MFFYDKILYQYFRKSNARGDGKHIGSNDAMMQSGPKPAAAIKGAEEIQGGVIFERY